LISEWSFENFEQYNSMNSTMDINSTMASFQFCVNVCIPSITHETFIRLVCMSNTSSFLKETKTAYPSRAPGFPLDFWWVRVAKLFNCLCCVLFCWIYSWILFPNAWINHNLNAFRRVLQNWKDAIVLFMSIVLFMLLYCSWYCTVHAIVLFMCIVLFMLLYYSCYCTVYVYCTVHAIALFMSLYCSCYCTQ
jgi:hypothetical protein